MKMVRCGDIVEQSIRLPSGNGPIMLHGRALRYIDEVARQGSIRKAAKTLHVAASAVNRYILELEEELQAPIFERLPRGLKLTSSGEILIQHIRETLQAHQRMRAQIQSLKGLNRGEVVLATMATLAAGRVAEIVAAYREKHPQVSLRIMVGDRTTVAEMVALGQADLAIAYNLPDDTRLQRAAEFRHALGAVVAPAHPLANRKTVRMSDCLIYPLVLADRSLSLREVVEATAPARATLVPVVETNSMELMKRLARTTPHITFLNRLDVDREMATGDLVFIPLTGTGSLQRLNILHRARGSLSPAGSHFMQFAQERLLASFDES
ncbi:LysR family transcriptional regulator [Rhizobium leguminosarum bv. viciae]|uniref:LysR family transcriptional regulator n=1 Tax=Rhizobium leguminosarum bv. viciae TaxID=387 RepID=A0A8I2GQY7_RHILV|nr:LysR family transcriptional regulator [Rhizobium leguminosarum]MBY5821749.1 LysR family transcriptional regulator [Rhizobium leguminosarum]NKM46293.1 LysR family transcriptional regulator [Rhizobium leguminosarum bv. viciae]NKM97472.1 LysR family transcriptional regulator [Rhizobium leguminosarum bv. viciae]TBY75255.1 LysR family transcriptional regulator [Rhizobium leguminosarum bv. viciae]TCA01588.1 LysR family transcriptional regulator [Rhizobium leguminosarum bv. viciae]